MHSDELLEQGGFHYTEVDGNEAHGMNYVFEFSVDAPEKERFKELCIDRQDRNLWLTAIAGLIYRAGNCCNEAWASI